MNDIEKRARELLAEVSGWNVDDMVEHLRSDVCVFTADEALAAVRSALAPPEVSATTQRLIDLLIERDRAGRAKYGTTLDRTDLTRDQWLQHMVEELLDGAGYALAAQRPEVP